jgi:hypothetical protein
MADKKSISISYLKLKKILCSIVLLSSLALPLGTTAVTIDPNQANNYAKYTIQSSTGNGNNDLEANIDSIIVIFNTSTTVPGSIDPSLVTVNNTTSNAVSVSGRRVSILTPVFIRRNGTPFTVVISSSANIQNPSTPASTYTLQVATTKETAVTSQQYTISVSSSTVTAAAVTPNPSVEGEAAAYSIAFNVGSGGALIANESTITIVFPPATTVPSGFISGVTVNGTLASATASGQTVVITMPVNVANNGSVAVVFAIGSGLQNPASAGSYTLAVRSSTETNFVTSDSYTISSAENISVSAITTKPDTANQSDTFELDFRVGSMGALTANSDTITLVFQPNTYLPADMAPANITISSSGFCDNAAGVEVIKNNNTDDDTLHIVTPINIGNSADVTVSLNSSSGYLNPSLAGNYTLLLYTSQEPAGATSNPYAIYNTTTKVGMATVIPASNTQNAYTSYTISFNLGRLGRLKAGESTITSTFNSNYTISETSSDYNASQIIIGETDVYDLTSSEIAPNNTAKTIQISIPDDAEVNNGDNIQVILDGSTTDPIRNPNTQGNYTLSVKTSVEPTAVTSYTYNIGGTSITALTVTSANNTVNTAAQYNIFFNISTELRTNDNDYITVVFPEGTALPSSIAPANVSIEGTAKTVNNITVTPSTRTVVIPIEARIRTSANPVTVQFSSSANIISAIVPSSTFYKLNVYTSKNTNPVTSPAFSVSGNNSRVTSVTGTVNPAAINASGLQFIVNFTTTANGKIAGGRPTGSSTVTIDFDVATTVPTSMTANAVRINATPCTQVNVLSSGSGGVVCLTVPNGLIVNSSTATKVVFDTSAGLANGGTAGTYDLQVRTSSDTLYSETTGTNGDYTLVTSQSLSVTSVTPNPAIQNAAASYSVKFKTGSPGGALSVGDSISLIFPVNTYIPASASPNDITVNGCSLTENPVISANTLKITVPTGVAIGNLADVTVLINQATGILNPTVVAGYVLQVSTESETGPYNSPSYNITQTNTTVSAANITVETPTPSTASAYTIEFSVGARGRLYAGTSSIIITFNASTNVNSTTTKYNNTSITVDGTQTAIPTENISINSRAVTMIVPSTVSVDNNDQVTLVIDGATVVPITNPASESSYTLQVRTSVETSNITSNSYPISSVGAVSNVTIVLSDSMVNATSSDTISFRVDGSAGALSASTDAITLKFPNNTLVPASIATSNIRVATTTGGISSFANASAVVTNSATRSITLNMPATVSASNGDSIRVAILTGTGVQNPSIYGSYILHVNTSTQPVDGISASYTLTAATSSISNLNIAIDPSSYSTIAEHTFTFTTGAYGRLLSGTSTIILIIPDDAAFALGEPVPSKITVISTQVQSVTLNTGSGTDPDTLNVTVPSSVTIGNITDVTVIIDATAGLRTPSMAGFLTYSAYTSVEPTKTNHDYSLPVQLTTFESKAEEGAIVLFWQTESELNNAVWLIERKEISQEEYQEIDKGILPIVRTDQKFELLNELDGQGTVSEVTEYKYRDIEVGDGKIYAYRLADISYDGSIFYHEPIIQKAAVPLRFELYQNYPNPFNPVTTIKFSLPLAAEVKLVIYNILGQQVVKLTDKDFKAGWHKLQWNGLNSQGLHVTSGMYIYRIDARCMRDNKRFVKAYKMILLK